MHRDREGSLWLKWPNPIWQTKGNRYPSRRQLRSRFRIQEQRRSFPQSEASTKIISDVQYLDGRMNRHSSNPPFRLPDTGPGQVHYEVRTLRTRCVTPDGNSDAHTHERSFLYLLTAFDPSGPKRRSGRFAQL